MDVCSAVLSSLPHAIRVREYIPDGAVKERGANQSEQSGNSKLSWTVSVGKVGFFLLHSTGYPPHRNKQMVN